MKNLLLSAAIGDIGGMPYEFENRTKNYNAVDLLLSSNTYTDIPFARLHARKHLLRI